MYLLKPSCASPGVSCKACSLILSMYSPLATAVVISLAVYAMGRPICSVSSLASSSCLSLMSCKALRTIFWRSENGVLRYFKNAFCADFGSSASFASVGPWRSSMGLLVDGEMVVIFSEAISLLITTACRTI